jgi:hypothetical protein
MIEAAVRISILDAVFEIERPGAGAFGGGSPPCAAANHCFFRTSIFAALLDPEIQIWTLSR